MIDLTIVELRDAAQNPGLVESAYTHVLRPSFTSDELPGPGGVRPGPARVLTVAVDGAGVPVGAAVTELEPEGIGLLAYLAVAPAGRGLGVGGRLVAELHALWRAEDQSLVLAEVHDPRGHAESDDEHPEARLRFYGRAGAQLLDVPWVQPGLGGGARVPDMLLLAVHRTDPERPDVASAPLVAWTREYFTESEGREPDDAQAVALLARIEADERIRVLPLGEWRRVERLAALPTA